MPIKNHISKIVLLGSGGHARVLLDTMQAAGMPTPAAVVTADTSQWGGRFCGIEVQGGDASLEELCRLGFETFVLGIGSAGDTGPRQAVWQRALRLGLAPLTVIHPTVIVSPSCQVGNGVQLLARCVINAAAELADAVIVNTAAIVEHDCRIGSGSHIATGATICGGVQIGAGVHVGAGAVIRQGISVGPGALIGAGAVVVRDVEPYACVVGNPARPLKRNISEMR
jgi:sugar O-acyltransferase (sialic acid O-acetyltransferase NeuD family)